ncbi:lipoprotein [Spiroplasma culicicola]|uniref:Lipoprotein n=1 Tax=Spiroplasma culicicola AES-1 TaxID=1276246 RepID=W6A7K1_9MOLU|nr:lipoprotein [Spiroplasma culicicola]AHI52961.1 hypothetical protein SCULI_v1c06200 [Spiroplasma culicicola AES-1]
MKKLLGLLGAMGMVASTSSVVIACGDKPEDTKALTPAEGVDAAKIIETFEIEQADGKISKNYEDTAAIPEAEGIPGIEGFPGSTSTVEFDTTKVLFNETKELEGQNLETGIGYMFSIQAKQDDTSATIYVIKTDASGLTEEGKGTIKNTTVYKYKVDLPQPEVKELKADDVKAKTTGIKDLADLAAVNTELAKITMDGLESLTAVAKDGSETDVTVTIAVAEGYTLVGDATFDIAGAIKEETTPEVKELKAEEVVAKTTGIKDLADLAAVNTELAKITMDGLESLTAVAKDGSETDVTVTITVAEGYTLVGDATFDIAGAILVTPEGEDQA